jgi:hypothetical protein
MQQVLPRPALAGAGGDDPGELLHLLQERLRQGYVVSAAVAVVALLVAIAALVFALAW